MEFLKVLTVSLCLIVLLLSNCAAMAQENKVVKKDTANAPQQQQSTIYTIKRLDTTKDNKHAMQQKQKQKATNHQQLQQKQQQLQPPQPHQQSPHVEDTLTVASKLPHTKKFKNSAKHTHALNKKLLSKMGFTKVKAPNSHNRKRLAIESRHHASPDDSHMFIIKLPPNFYYYTSPKASPGGGSVANSNSQNSLVPQSQTLVHHAHEQQPTVTVTETDAEKMLHANGKKVNFPFSSNGKPGRIYHWNLPIIKKMLEDKQRFPNVSGATKDQLIDIKDIPTWTRPWENETIEKSYGKSSMMSYKKSLKHKSPSYYAPANAVNKNSFNKYFSGNGKPKGFYVIKENQKKPLYYKNIVS